MIFYRWLFLEIESLIFDFSNENRVFSNCVFGQTEHLFDRRINLYEAHIANYPV